MTTSVSIPRIFSRVNRSKGKCLIASYDYLDLDVYLNVKLFYQSCGYRVCRSGDLGEVALLVLLRGLPERIEKSYNGVLHVYDYVAEQQEDCWRYFPNAQKSYLISLVVHQSLPPEVAYIRGYLPVMAGIWQPAKAGAKMREPVHISNYKEIGDDRYQKELLQIALAGDVQVYGSGWSAHGIQSGRISLRRGNQLLARAPYCYGLMYPHQRGITLSGRMWQAPLNGCFVISESITNVYNCPGVIEVASFLNPGMSLNELLCHCDDLRLEAARFWRSSTKKLASDLELTAFSEPHPGSVMVIKLDILLQHLSFSWQRQKNRIKAYWEIARHVARRLSSRVN